VNLMYCQQQVAATSTPVPEKPTATATFGAPPPPPPPPATNTPGKKGDTTPPLVNVTSVSSFVVYYVSGCGPNMLTVEAYVTDESRIGSVTLLIRYVGYAGNILAPMNLVGGNTAARTMWAGRHMPCSAA